MTVSASTSAYGSASMSTRSLNVPGSDSSALHTTYLGRTGLAATASHLMCVGNAAPPRPSSDTRPPTAQSVGRDDAEPASVLDDSDRCGTSTPSGTSAGDSPVVSACQTASGVTGARSRLGTAAPACWISAAEPRSHWPRHGDRCQGPPVP